MGMMKGSWSLWSETNPKWNCHGRGQVGCLVMPEEAKEKRDELTKNLGEPPDDLMYSYCKD